MDIFLSNEDEQILFDFLKKGTLKALKIARMPTLNIEEILKVMKKALLVEEFCICYMDCDEGCFSKIEDLLSTNNTLKIFSMCFSNLEGKRFKHVCDGLSENSSIQQVNFVSSRIGDEGAGYVGELLKVNGSIKKLYLSANQIGNEGMKMISEALKTNESVLHIYLSTNSFDDEGVRVLTEAIKTSSKTKISELVLSDNSISYKSSLHLKECLRFAPTLIKVEISDTLITDQEEILLMAEKNLSEKRSFLSVSQSMLILHNRKDCIVSVLPRMVCLYLLQFISKLKLF